MGLVLLMQRGQKFAGMVADKVEAFQKALISR
jgi:hypothetical protein